MNANKKKAKSANLSKNEVDVIVLGVGTCGEDLSLRLLRAGLSVVGIEAYLVGGECAYWACLPSKFMIRQGNLLQEARRVNGKAGQAEVTPDWDIIAARLRAEVTGGWQDSYAVARFGRNGGTLIHGRGRLTGLREVTVGDQRITARIGVVIATGSQPFIPPIPGLAAVDYWTTHDAIQAETLPKSLIVLGGGAVGCELGQLFSRFGVAVTIVEAADRLLSAEEPEASAVVQSVFNAEGINVHTGMAAEQVRMYDGSIMVTLAGGSEISAERLLVATGRRVDLSGLGLESVGLDESASFIPVDEKMRAADGIWAMGDVTGKGMFTHIAGYQSTIIAADILGLDHAPARYDTLPRATFTDPEVGAVGLTEAGARAAGLDVVVVVKQLSATFRGWLHGSGNGVIKLIFEKGSGVLVGATAVGPHGGEMLGMLSLAVHTGVTSAELRGMIYAFPTFYGGIGEAVGAFGRGLAAAIDPDYKDFEFLDGLGTAEK